jgi:pimeloyl-ACP methyl ester carboxylesterase
LDTEKIFSLHENRTGLPQLGSVFYERCGEPSAPCLVLIHGFPFDRRLWYKLIPHLSGLQLIIPDLPGVGNSTIKAATMRMEDYALCIKAVLEQEGIGRCVLAGHSMGGYVALAFAELYPSMLAGLSLVHSSALADDEERKKKRMQIMEFIRMQGVEKFARSFVPGPFAPSYADEQEKEKLIRWASECSAEGLLAATDAMLHRPDRTHVLREASMPVQWIIGDKDPVFQAETSFAQAALSERVQIDLLKESGHMGMIEETRLMAEALKTFCEFCSRS